MSLELDARQRAMLREMGVWLPWGAGVRGSAGHPEPVEGPAQGKSFDRLSPSGVGGATKGFDRLSPNGGGGASKGFDELSPDGAGTVRPEPVEGPLQPLVPIEAQLDALGWDELAQAVAGCQACGLCASRRNTVFGVGDRQADWLVVGEAPGEHEDLQGEPFVGQAGKLLDNMLRAVGRDRQQGVYIANVLKCRPPGNRNPEPAEVAQCEPFLRRQVALLKPRIILAMGRFAVQSLLGTSEPIGRLRGRVHRYQDVPVVITYHPAYLLRNLPDKAKAWADLCLAQSVLDADR